MLTAVSKYWWVLLLRGILAILFGIAIWLMPGLTLVVLVTVFGAYALVDGAAAIFLSFSSRNTDKDWGMHLIEGILGVIFGIVVLTWPELAVVTSSITILVLIAFWAISTGIMQIVAAIRLRKEIDNEFWLGLSGLLSVIFGFVILRFPMGTALTLTWLIGVYSVVFGVFFIMLAFRVRSLGSTSASA
jgi:uncharacterized membrane protein HdeD (DUF308 family)